ncbi:MAG: aspartate aminotransferase [Sphingobacteriales bacterium]|jgi:aspartate aminotransferase
MDSRLSKRINKLAVSETIAMAKLSRELKAEGKDIINLSLGEPDFDTPNHIKQAAKDAIDQNYSHYTAVAGFLDLRESICVKLKKHNNLDYKPSEIVVSTGAKQSIANAVMCMVNKGDEVIIPVPYWVSYGEIVKMANATSVFIESTLENKYKISAEQLEKAITKKTKLFIFNSPSNPTGSVYSFDELKALAEVLKRHPQVYILSDEIYEFITFGVKHRSFAEFPELKDRVILVNGVSKAYAMTGWRLGYMAAPEFIAAACDKFQGQITSATCAISQRATIAAMLGTMDDTWKMKEAFEARRNLSLKLLNEIPGLKTYVPDGAFYIFPEISSFFGKSSGEYTINDANELALYLLHDANVSTVTGNAFGCRNNIRISVATNETDLKKAFSRIKDSLAKLN